MNRGIYTTALGMSSLQRGMDVTSNNLANASTNGFKRDALIFQDTLQREMYGNGGFGQKVGTLGAGASPVEEYTVSEQGVVTNTNNPLDLAITQPDGMFAVKTPEGTRYTRDGSFTLDEQRRLVSKAGYPVLDKDGNEIVVPEGDLHSENGGKIVVAGNLIAEVGVWTSQANSKFVKEGASLFKASGDVQAVDDSPIEAHSLEGSNVNAIEAMLEMIKVGRLFELSQKNIQSQDDLLQQLINSLNE